MTTTQSIDRFADLKTLARECIEAYGAYEDTTEFDENGDEVFVTKTLHFDQLGAFAEVLDEIGYDLDDLNGAIESIVG